MSSKYREDIFFSFGSLRDEDKSWDKEFWNKASVLDKLKATTELVSHAYKVKYKIDLSLTVDKSVTEYGKLV